VNCKLDSKDRLMLVIWFSIGDKWRRARFSCVTYTHPTVT